MRMMGNWILAGVVVLSAAPGCSCSPSRARKAPARGSEERGESGQKQEATGNTVTIDGCTVDLDNLANLSLRDTCVYRRDQGGIAAGKDPVEIAYQYAPAFALWSDGASK